MTPVVIRYLIIQSGVEVLKMAQSTKTQHPDWSIVIRSKLRRCHMSQNTYLAKKK
jgi:hypothetical protein